jgi:hypothetical protein
MTNIRTRSSLAVRGAAQVLEGAVEEAVGRKAETSCKRLRDVLLQIPHCALRPCLVEYDNNRLSCTTFRRWHKRFYLELYPEAGRGNAGSNKHDSVLSFGGLPA